MRVHENMLNVIIRILKSRIKFDNRVSSRSVVWGSDSPISFMVYLNHIEGNIFLRVQKG